MRTVFRLSLILLILALASVIPAFALPVGLELVLAVDVSGSINSNEFNLQKTGYVNAFNSADVVDAILNGTTGSIAVSLVYWSSSNLQQQAVGWMLIDDASSASDFGAAIDATSRPFSGVTSISGAIDFSVPLFEGNGFEGIRRVIDVSGDGTNNSGRSVTAARDDALTAGININGVAIGSESLRNYYENNVIGGSNSFALLAADFESFGDAVQMKLLREITPIPEPSTHLLIGFGIFGLIGLRRKLQ